MKIGWILVVLIWSIPIASMFACPYDLHGLSTCSALEQAARTLAFYIVFPGLWLGSSISQAMSSDPHAGASFPAFVFGILVWLALLSGIILYVAKRLSVRQVTEL